MIVKRFDIGKPLLISMWIITIIILLINIPRDYIPIELSLIEEIKDDIISILPILFLLALGIVAFVIGYTTFPPTQTNKRRLKRFYKRMRDSLREEEKVKEEEREIKEDIVIKKLKPLFASKHIRKLSDKLSPTLGEDILASGIPVNARLVTSRSIAYTLISAGIMIPLSIYLAVNYHPSLFALILTPLIAFLYPFMQLKSIIKEREKRIEDELAFFIVYTAIMQHVGRSLYNALNDIIGVNIFRIIEREALLVKRNIEFFAMDPLDAINNLALSHPNRTFREVLLGYTAIARSGGDIVRYMEGKANEAFNDIKFKMSKYTNDASTISEIMLLALIVMPMLIIAGSFIVPGLFMQIFGPVSFIGIPILAGLLIFITEHAQPKIRDEVRHTNYMLIIGGVVGVIMLYYTLTQGLDAWIALGAAGLAASIVNAIYMLPQLRMINTIERTLPEFMRDLTEYRKIGYDIQQTIVKLSKERVYNKVFDNILKEIAAKVELGYSLYESFSSLKVRSWIAKLVFFNLAKIGESGGGSPELLEYMTNFLTQYTRAKKEMLASVRLYTIIAYVGPLLMAWILKTSIEMMQTLGPALSEFYGTTLLEVTDEFTGLINTVIMISAIGMGMIISKVTTLTIKNTFHVVIIIIITIITVILMPYLPSLMPSVEIIPNQGVNINP